MAQLLLNNNIVIDSDFEEDNNVDNEELLNYRGHFYNEEEQERYFEYGAHFPYEYVCQMLEIIKETRENFNKYNSEPVEGKISQGINRGILQKIKLDKNLKTSRIIIYVQFIKRRRRIFSKHLRFKKTSYFQ